MFQLLVENKTRQYSKSGINNFFFRMMTLSIFDELGAELYVYLTQYCALEYGKLLALPTQTFSFASEPYHTIYSQLHTISSIETSCILTRETNVDRGRRMCMYVRIHRNIYAEMSFRV